MTLAESRAPIPGIHHVTAIASDPQAKFDLYARVLGLRLVKKTVDFDDPGTYYLYFGVDEAPEELGTGLRLPDVLEPSRPAIEGRLPVLDTEVREAAGAAP